MCSISGEPNKGIHSYRDPIFNLAIVDVLLTLIAAYTIAKYTSYKNTIYNFIALVVLSLLIHKYFGVKTKLMEYTKL
jgi:hypothetical protein